MESFATPYPVIFFDGEQEQNVGYVGIHSVLTYKRFQSLLSQKTRVPANQLSAVFVCRRAQKGTERRQRLPINSNTNFSILLNQHNPSKERDCYFFVSVKKSKKERKGSRKRSAEIDNPDDWESVSSIGDSSQFEEMVQANTMVEEMLSEEALASFIQGNTSTSTKTAIGGMNDQRHEDDSTLHRRRSDFGSADHNRGKILLRRQIAQPNIASAPRRGRASRVQVLDDVNTQPSNADAGISQVQNSRPSHRDQQKALTFWTQESFNGQKSEHLKLNAPIFLPSDRTHHPYEAFYAESFNNNFSEAPPVRSSSLSMQRSGGLPPGYSYQTFLPAPRIPSVSAIGTMRDTDLRTPYDRIFQMQQSQTLAGEFPPNFFATSGPFAGFQGGVDAERQNICCEVCFDCKKRNISPIPFHWCVQDKVISGFRGPSPAGPIGRRPQTHHVKAAA